jgi:hypothetical protein
VNDPKPMTVLWSEARRSVAEGKAWNDSLPKWEPLIPSTPKPEEPGRWPRKEVPRGR